MMTKNNNIIKDLAVLQDYIANNEIDSYVIVAVAKDRKSVFNTYDVPGNPNDLLANLEILLTRLKMMLVMEEMQTLALDNLELIPDDLSNKRH